MNKKAQGQGEGGIEGAEGEGRKKGRKEEGGWEGNFV